MEHNKTCNNYQQINNNDVPEKKGIENLVGFFEVLIKIDKRLQNEPEKSEDQHD